LRDWSYDESQDVPEVLGRFVHELHVTRPSGGHHRIPAKHRLGNRQTKSFRSVESCINIGLPHQR
jgi:hypothetical protein